MCMAGYSYGMSPAGTGVGKAPRKDPPVKMHLLLSMHVDVERWATAYGIAAHRDTVADGVIDYYGQEVISGSRVTGLVKILDTCEVVLPGFAKAAHLGRASVCVDVHLEVDLLGWARKHKVSADRAIVAAHVMEYFQHAVLDGSAPIAMQLLHLDSLAAIARKDPPRRSS